MYNRNRTKVKSALNWATLKRCLYFYIFFPRWIGYIRAVARRMEWGCPCGVCRQARSRSESSNRSLICQAWLVVNYEPRLLDSKKTNHKIYWNVISNIIHDTSRWRRYINLTFKKILCTVPIFVFSWIFFWRSYSLTNLTSVTVLYIMKYFC